MEVNTMIQLNVPLIRGTKSQSCWHDAARMIYAYKRKASINPLNNSYLANQGLNPARFVELAEAIGMVVLPGLPATYSSAFFEKVLRSNGPIWAAGYWNKAGAGHVVVITGVDAAGNLNINDPALLQPQIHDLSWFNSKLARDVCTPLMYLS